MGLSCLCAFFIRVLISNHDTQSDNRRKHLNIYIILRSDCQAEDKLLALLFSELIIYASKRYNLHNPWTDLIQSHTIDDVTSFSESTLRLVHRLADELPQVIAKSDKPQWNLLSFQFSLDVW